MAMSVPATMRAQQQTSRHGPQDLRLITDAPVPVPGPGEVLIRVAAAGVNFGDIAQARGTFPGGPQPPYLAGFEAAGEIAAAGATGQAAVKLARHYGATVIAAAAPGKHEAVRALGADHVLDSRGAGLAAQVLRLTGGAGADLVLESAGGATLGASLAAARRVTGRVVVYGVAGGEAPVTNWELVYQHQVHVIGLNLGVLVQAAPQIFGEVMAELFALIAAGVLTPGQPAVYDLADGPKALAELESRATVGKLALLP
jgi:NADPH:quinone reductase-like Zn-dependent oxidoreductase